MSATVRATQKPLSQGQAYRDFSPVPYTNDQHAMDAPGFFWTPPDHITTDTVTLIGPEARHAFSACRLRAGELITVTDGAGNAYDCQIAKASAKEVSGAIVRVHRQRGEPVAQVTLAVGIGRPQVYDWIIEKAVELGAARILPLRCHASPSGIGGAEAGARRVDRWRRLALGAMKQSLRTVLPVVDPIATPEAAVPLLAGHARAWLADPTGGRLSAAPPIGRAARVMLIIGPEGGFDPAERELFFAHGAQLINLGPRRLRAETAAIAALTLVMQHLGEL
jgi:16S rRNA (uracil1498-N3)-methyltransferase